MNKRYATLAVLLCASSALVARINVSTKRPVFTTMPVRPRVAPTPARRIDLTRRSDFNAHVRIRLFDKGVDRDQMLIDRIWNTVASHGQFTRAAIEEAILQHTGK